MSLTKLEWFKAWFDSPYYHLLYNKRDFTEAEFFIDNLVTKLKFQANASILDLACGRGRHSIYLAKKGFDVTGLDISPQSISYASQFETDKLSFYVHDMRRPFRINYYAVVLNLFTSFGYFKNRVENWQVITAINDALVPGGTVVIDFMNSIKVMAELIPFETQQVNNITFNIRRYICDNAVCKEITFNDGDSSYHFEEYVQAFTLPDFETCFSALKMQIIHVYGDYNLSAFNEVTSERLIVVAKKISN